MGIRSWSIRPALLPHGIHARGTFPVAVATADLSRDRQGWSAVVQAVRLGAGMNHPGILTAAPPWKLVAAVNLGGGGTETGVARRRLLGDSVAGIRHTAGFREYCSSGGYLVKVRQKNSRAPHPL